MGWIKSRHPGSSVLHILWFGACRMCCAIVLMLVYRLRWTGRKNVPYTGPLLVVANHQSYADPPVVGVICGPRHFDFIARGGLFDNPRFGGLIASLNAIPIKENGGDAAAMKEAIQRLNAGRAVLIFPEGSRTYDGELQQFKRGVAVLVKRANCPILPVGIDGPFDAWPRTRKRPRFFGVRFAGAIGTPIPHDELMRDGPDAAMERLHDEVAALVAKARALRR